MTYVSKYINVKIFEKVEISLKRLHLGIGNTSKSPSKMKRRFEIYEENYTIAHKTVNIKKY